MKKFRIVVSHMNTTHWEVHALDKEDATKEAVLLIDSLHFSKNKKEYEHANYEKTVYTIPDCAVLAVEELDEKNEKEWGKKLR